MPHLKYPKLMETRPPQCHSATAPNSNFFSGDHQYGFCKAKTLSASSCLAGTGEICVVFSLLWFELIAQTTKLSSNVNFMGPRKGSSAIILDRIGSNHLELPFAHPVQTAFYTISVLQILLLRLQQKVFIQGPTQWSQALKPIVSK